MKTLIHLFAFYLFSLSLAPCGEGGAGIIGIFDVLNGQNKLVVPQNNDPCEDTPCSPFCICSSCVPILFTPEVETVLPIRKRVLISKDTPSYDSLFFPSSYHKDIWQPPKLG